MERITRRPTIKQVALESGVSTQTVSRVINNRPDVADETRTRVKDVIKRVGYQPSALARSLIQKKSHTLGVVTAGLKYIGPSRTLNGITNTAEEVGYSLLLKELPHFSANNVLPIFNELLSRQVDGIIWAAPEIGNNRDWVDDFPYKLNVPIVYLTMQVREGFSIISANNYLGGKMAATHLVESGYRHIGHISGPMDWWESRQRFDAWKDVVQAAGQGDIDQCWVAGNWSSASGLEAAANLFDKYPQMDAILSANDQMALGALSVIYSRGLRVPEDIGIVGFDNIAESEYFLPPLTTIHQNQYQVGVMAVKEIIRIIDAIEKNTEFDYRVTMLEPEILVRKSSIRS